MGDALDRARDNVTVVSALLLVGLFIALNVLGLSTLANVTLFVGFPVIVPLVYLLFADRGGAEQSGSASDRERAATESDAATESREPVDEVERLREQYASGKITEVEFEQRIEEHLDPDVDDEPVPADGQAIEAELERIRNE